MLTFLKQRRLDNSFGFETWTADRTLSRRKTAFLEKTHTQMMLVLENEACMEPNVASLWMTDELDRKDIFYECQCVTDLLDYLNPRSGRIPR